VDNGILIIMPIINHKQMKTIRVKNLAHKMDHYDINRITKSEKESKLELNLDEIYLIKDMIKYFRMNEISISNELKFAIDSDSILNKIYNYLANKPTNDNREYITFQVKPESIREPQEDKLIDKLKRMNKKQRLEYWNNASHSEK
jgi:hypothetical protein